MYLALFHIKLTILPQKINNPTKTTAIIICFKDPLSKKNNDKYPDIEKITGDTINPKKFTLILKLLINNVVKKIINNNRIKKNNHSVGKFINNSKTKTQPRPEIRGRIFLKKIIIYFVAGLAPLEKAFTSVPLNSLR